MSEENPARKKRWGLLKRSNSNPQLAEEGGRRAASDPSSLSPSRNGLSRFLPKSFHKSTRSARQSPNPEPTVAGSSAQNPLHLQTSQDLPLPTVPPEPNPDQSSDVGVVNTSLTITPEQPDLKLVKEKLANAKAHLGGIKHVSGMVENTASASDNLQSASDTIDTFSQVLAPLRVFNSVVTGLADVHPYAKVALSIFTFASKMILDQANRDAAVSRLLSKISDIYVLLMEGDRLARISSMLEIYGKIARQTLECADFVVHYSDMQNFWRRLGKHVLSETEATMQCYNEVLDNLMHQFRDQMALTTIETVHRIAEDLDVSGMEYVPGAGRNTSKDCLPGTREDILSEIKCWVRSTGEDVPRVLWLSGTAGKGKSAIAHTIANWSHERGGMRACFCFDRTRVAEHRHEKIFTTIARDLANCDITMRGALARAVHDDDELKHTVDVLRQWQELVVKPIDEASKTVTAPVLIVIDALDESGDAKSREQILRLISGDTSTSSPLPSNFRIIVTSRPLEDIADALKTTPRHRHISMDEIPVVSTQRDIRLYISVMLKGPRSTFDDGHFKTLADKSDGLFEWARLACEYIKGTNKVGVGPVGRYKAVIAGTSSSKTATHLLDDMYRRILADIMPLEDEAAIAMFRSVMGQIVASPEPLSMTALTAMRLHFPHEEDRVQVDWVIGPMASLLTGTTDFHTLIRPLHASFYDFLTDSSRSHDFFVDTSPVQTDLAFASLGVMEHGLRFNICSLENSYLPNSSVPDLETRIKDSIPTELSYSCRFWGTHVGSASFEPSLAKGVEAFFDGERLLWWLEALALMKSLGNSIVTLSSIADWFSNHPEFAHVRDAIRDTLRFVRTFATTISRSTPHLYLSALPFAPTQSRMFRKFASKFPCTPRIVAGHVENWPQVEKILHANDAVYSVALSPDGKCVACGLYDGTIQLWDMNTGEELCATLEGHTGRVTSVAFSPDGHRVVSGSWDKTVRVWDVKTGEASGSPLQGHTDRVWSVAISQDGKRIVSGSRDNTIRVWDMEAGEAFGAPLQGHTNTVWSVAISPDGKCIVSGSGDRTIRVWDMETGKPLGASLQGHVDRVRSVAISPDGKRIVSGSEDGTIRLWDMETGEAIGTPLKGHTQAVTSVAIFSDGNRIVSGSFDETIRAWDAKTGEAVGYPLQGHTDRIQSLAISLDGSHIVTGSDDNTIRVWTANIIMGKASVTALECHTDTVNSVAISPDGCSIVSGSDDTTVRVWDIETGKALVAPLQGHTDSVSSVAVSSDGKVIVSGSGDESIRMWNAETGKASGILQGHTDYVQSVAISPDRKHIVSGSEDSTIRVWDIETGEAYSLCGHSDSVLSVAISSDGNRIVSGSDDGTIEVWDSMGTGEASNSRLQGHISEVLSAAISPDVCRIVSGSRDKTIRVWDIGTGEQVGSPLQGHTDDVGTVAISSDGHRIVSGSDDETIRVWDMKTGEVVATIRGHTGCVMSVAISLDGKRIVSGSSNKTIRVWDLEFLIRHHQSFEAPTICFSSDLTHALHSASFFLQDSKSKTPAPSSAPSSSSSSESESKTSAPSSSSSDSELDSEFDSESESESDSEYESDSESESESETHYVPNEEGWVIGPEGRLLLWIPLNFHSAVYAPGNTLVIANNALQLDLSRVAHGTSWHRCREQ